jgi:hypothetical protein
MLNLLWWVWLVVLTMAGALLGIYCWALSDENKRLQAILDADPDCHQCHLVETVKAQGRALDLAWDQIDQLHREKARTT